MTSFVVQRAAELAVHPEWTQEPTCSAMLARHDDRWVDAPSYHVPPAVAERSSDDQHPFGHGGAMPDQHRVSRLVLGHGMVHDNHETWLLRCIVFFGKCGAWRTSVP